MNTSWQPPYEPAERDVVEVTGKDAASYLQSQLSQDIRNLADGEQTWTLVLQPTGKVDALARVTRIDAERFELDTDPGFGETLNARLARFKIRVDASLSLRTATQTASDENEAARIGAGWPRMGSEIIPGQTIPAETGITDRAVSFTKGCYPGQELVERMDSRGASAPRHLETVDVAADAQPGDPLIRDGVNVGVLTSVSGTKAIALVRRNA